MVMEFSLKFGIIWDGWFGKGLLALRLRCTTRLNYKSRMDVRTGSNKPTYQNGITKDFQTGRRRVV